MITALLAFATKNWQAIAVALLVAAAALAYHLRIVSAQEAGYAKATEEQAAAQAETLRHERKAAQVQQQSADAVGREQAKNTAVLNERLTALKGKVYALQTKGSADRAECAIVGGLRADYERAINSYRNGSGDSSASTPGANSAAAADAPVACTDLATTAAYNAEVGSYCCGVAAGWQRWWTGQLENAAKFETKPKGN
jgi:hypothetical protein